MSFCFLVEENYRHDGMPKEVLRRLREWGHHVDVIRPGRELTCISESVRAGSHDAWVLKTVAGGPGLTLLEAAAGVGLTTVNDVRSIRGVRDKAVAAALGRSGGLPVPVTYVGAGTEVFGQVPEGDWPLVVKPVGGSGGRGVRLVASVEDLAGAEVELVDEGLLIAQSYVPNSGVDLKVYGVGGELFAVERSSPLCVGGSGDERWVPLPREVAAVAARVGTVYGLDLYGVDVVLGPDGPVVVDVNDFPSFRGVPGAVGRVAGAVVELARDGGGVRADGSYESGGSGGGPGVWVDGVPGAVGRVGCGESG